MRKLTLITLILFVILGSTTLAYEGGTAEHWTGANINLWGGTTVTSYGGFDENNPVGRAHDNSSYYFGGTSYTGYAAGGGASINYTFDQEYTVYSVGMSLERSAIYSDGTYNVSCWDDANTLTTLLYNTSGTDSQNISVSDLSINCITLLYKADGCSEGNWCLVEENTALIANTTVITPIYPLNDSGQNNYNGWINLTGTDEEGLFNNCTNNDTRWTQTNYYNIGSEANMSWYNTNFATLPNARHTINFSCTNNASTEVGYKLEFDIDDVSPTAVSSLDLNNSLAKGGTHWGLDYQINYTDNIKLYKLNISYDGVLNHTLTQVNGTFFIYNGTLNSTILSGGKHNITTTICDAHTAKKLKQSWSKNKNDIDKSITYNVDLGTYSIRPKDITWVQNYDTTQHQDRYTFSYDKKNKNTQDTFIINSTSPITIINDNKYGGWLVIDEFDRWIDFQTDETGITYTTKQNSPTEVEVTVKGHKGNQYDFRSTGELNCNTYTWEIFTYTTTLKISPNVLEGENQSIKMVINKSSQIELNISSNFYLNATFYNTTYSNISSQQNFSVTFLTPIIGQNTTSWNTYWNYSVNNVLYNTSVTNQTVGKIWIGNCGLFSNTTILNFTVLNEDTQLNILSDFNMILEDVYSPNGSNHYNFTFNKTNADHLSVCMYPEWATFTVFAYAKHIPTTQTGYTQRWYIVNASFDNTTSNKINMYNYNVTTGISTLLTENFDDTYNDYPNVVIKMQRYYAGEGIWKQVQTDKTDEFGQAVFYVKQNSEDYRFLFTNGDSGRLLYTSNPVKFICDTTTRCDQTFVITDSLSADTDWSGLSITQAYNNITGIITVTWNDANNVLNSMRVKVGQETMANETVICDTTVSSPSGVITCNVTSYDGTIWIKAYRSASPELAFFSNIITKTARALSSVIGREGMFLSMLVMTAAVGFGAVSPFATVIISSFGLLSIFWLGLASVFNITFLISGLVLGVIVGYMVNR